MALNLLHVKVTVPMAQMGKANYVLAARARKIAGGLKVTRVTSGGSFNTPTTGQYEARAVYVVHGVSLRKVRAELWQVNADRTRVHVTVYTTAAYAHRAAEQRKNELPKGDHWELRVPSNVF